jgi:small subunit ribosomal protein S6
MRTYELMILTTVDMDVSTEDKQKAIVSDMLKDTKNYSVTSIQLLGRKHLAYPIRKALEGQYILVKLEADALKTGVIEKTVKMKPEILRFLLLEIEHKKIRKLKHRVKKQDELR